jgi:hypothetical protein
MMSWPSGPPNVHSGLRKESSAASAARFAASIRFLTSQSSAQIRKKLQNQPCNPVCSFVKTSPCLKPQKTHDI